MSDVMLTKSMKQLERDTEQAYAAVCQARVDIKQCDDSARRMRILVVAPAVFLSMFFALAVSGAGAWLACIFPLLAWSGYFAAMTRRLYRLRTVERPSLVRTYHNALTDATEALQSQQEREQLRLMDREKFDKLEYDAWQVERHRRSEQEKVRRYKQEIELEMLHMKSPYGWL